MDKNNLGSKKKCPRNSLQQSLTALQRPLNALQENEFANHVRTGEGLNRKLTFGKFPTFPKVA